MNTQKKNLQGAAGKNRPYTYTLCIYRRPSWRAFLNQHGEKKRTTVAINPQQLFSNSYSFLFTTPQRLSRVYQDVSAPSTTISPLTGDEKGESNYTSLYGCLVISPTETRKKNRKFLMWYSQKTRTKKMTLFSGSLFSCLLFRCAATGKSSLTWRFCGVWTSWQPTTKKKSNKI